MARPRFGRDMGYEQLQSYLAHEEATPALRAFAPFLKSLCTSNHMIDVVKNGWALECICKAGLTDDASIGLLELEVIIAQLLRIESVADADDHKAAQKAANRAARHEREAQREPPPATQTKKKVVGETPPPVVHRQTMAAFSEKAAAPARAEEEAAEEARPRSWGTPSHTPFTDGAWTSERGEDDALDQVVESF